MAESASRKRGLIRAFLLVLVQALRMPFDVLFLTWDFLVVSGWGLRNLPSRLSGLPPEPFRSRREGRWIETHAGDALRNCSLAPKYGTKALLRLLCADLAWHTPDENEGERDLCWSGSSSRPPTTWGRYLLTGVVLALVWGLPTGTLAWRYRARLGSLMHAQQPQPGQHKQQTQASPTASPATRNDPGMAVQFVVEANDLERAGKKAEARQRFRDAAVRDVTSMEAQLGLGRLSLDSDLTDEAWQAFAKALDLDATNPQALLGMARVLHVQGADRKAVEVLETAIARTPGLAVAHALKATCLLAVDDLPGAGAAIEKALALAPDDEAAMATRPTLNCVRGTLRRPTPTTAGWLAGTSRT
jgi:tetratricopeptide (TPR) repeat protein